MVARVRTHLELKQARDCLARQNAKLEERIQERTQALEQSQRQAIQAEKMAAIGLLAAGIAHELNNPIGFVGLNVTVLSDYVNDFQSLVETARECLKGVADPALAAGYERELAEKDFEYLAQDSRELLAQTKDGLERMGRIVLNLKDFARTGDEIWQMADLHQGLESTLNVVWNEIKYKAEVVKNYGALPEVSCIPSEINQVFMNLLVNAAQAIEAHGQITISTEQVGDTVQIEIRDTGKGIPPESLSRVFEPFFTTKPVGKGTGLGLSLSHGIIQKHHGTLAVESEVGKGTSFRITLPITGETPTSRDNNR